MINSNYTSGSQAASALLSLRLVGIQNQNLTQHLLQQIRSDVVRKDINLSSGQLALIILALGACKTPNENLIYEHRLINQLENKFQEEIENMEMHNGNPLTNHYQVSLSLLALCLFEGKYSTTTVIKFFDPKNKNYYFFEEFSTDTSAMAVLALTCVSRSLTSGKTKEDRNSLKTINNYIQSLVKSLLFYEEVHSLMGNIYGVGDAMQALFVTSEQYQESEWNCKDTQDTILRESREVFSIPTAAAQVLPALLGKTYLDINRYAPCVDGLGKFNVSIQVLTPVPTLPPSHIKVHYSVYGNEIYSTDVIVPKGSSFLEMMEEAQKQDGTIFGFTLNYNKWGPYIQSINNVYENYHERTHWELLSEGKTLKEGVGNYIVHDGENLQARWGPF